MSYEVTKDFRRGLDARKFFLSEPAGSLTTCINGHITQGGEIEKRKTLSKITPGSPYAGSTFGMQPVAGGINIFGNDLSVCAGVYFRSRASNVAVIYVSDHAGVFLNSTIVNGTHIDVSGVGGGYDVTNAVVTSVFNDGVYYQISYSNTGANESTVATTFTSGLVFVHASIPPSPFVFTLLQYPLASTILNYSLLPTLTGIVSSTLFGSVPFVIAKFSDGSVIPYYGRLPIFDSYGGIVLPQDFVPAPNSMWERLAAAINASGSYTATGGVAGGAIDIFSIPTTLNGTPFVVTDTIQSELGSIALAQQTTGLAAVGATSPSGLFQIIAGDAGTQATGTIGSTVGSGTNVTDGDTVTVGGVTYRFKTTMALVNDVHRGGTRAASYASLAATINGTGVAGTDFFAGTVKNPSVICTGSNTTTGNFALSLAAIAGGTAGNSLALSTTGANITVSGATLTGAVASQITQIVVNGVTNLLSGAVAFTTDIPTTVAAVVANINANVSSGYQAIASNNTVTISKQVAGATANGFSVQVQAQGTLICGSGAFTLTGSGFTLDFCQANGVDLMADVSPFIPPNSSATVLTYPFVPSQVLSDFCRLAANSINSLTSTNGYIAFCAQGSVSIFIAKATVTSTDAQVVLNVSVTPSGGTGSAIPVTVTPLSASLSTNVVAVPSGGKSSSVTCNVTGGVAPYTYSWQQQGATSISSVIANNKKSAQTTFSGGFTNNASIQRQLAQYNLIKRTQGPTAAQNFLNTHPQLNAYIQATQNNQVVFACIVSDAIGEVATSDSVYVTLLTA